MAGRNPQPWFWKARRVWCVVHEGRRVTLGPDKGEAFQRFHRLMSGDGLPPTRPEPSGPSALTFDGLIRLYLDDLKRRVGTRTHYVAAGYLKPIVERCGSTPAVALRKAMIDAAVRSHDRWNATTENHVRCRIVAAYNWAVEQELLPSNPLKGLKKPRALTRGADALVSPADHLRLMAAAPPYVRNVLFVLQQTGCRPCEVLRVTAAEFDEAAGVWVLERHKSSHRTGRPRIIFLTPGEVELCRSLAGQFPVGPLFRRASGRAFPEAYYLPRLLRSLRKKLGLPVTLTPYSYRHGFATDALARGVPDAHVAELLGHTSTAMLHRHYAHLGAKATVLRESLRSVRHCEGQPQPKTDGHAEN